MKSQLLIAGILLLIGALFMLPEAYALDESDADYVIKQYSRFDIKRNCIYNGTVCGPAAECNITINSVQNSGTFLYNSTLMTNQGGFHNLTLNATDNSNTGWYQAFITCTDLGDEGSEIFYYRVTPTGDESNTSFFLIFCGLIVAIILFGYATRNLYFVFIGGICSLILGVYSMIFGFGNTSNDYTKMIAVVSIGIGFIFMFASAYTLLEQDGDSGYEEVEEINVE